MKILAKIITALIFLGFVACSSGFDTKKAQELLNKEQLTSEEYTKLIEIYENGIDDAINFSKKGENKPSEKEQEEMLMVFAIGIRLSKDDANLTSKQRQEFERINLKGKDSEEISDR